MSLAFAQGGLFENSDSGSDGEVDPAARFLPEYARLPLIALSSTKSEGNSAHSDGSRCGLSSGLVAGSEECRTGAQTEQENVVATQQNNSIVVRAWDVAGSRVALAAAAQAQHGYRGVGAVPWDGAFILGKFLEFQQQRCVCSHPSSSKDGDHERTPRLCSSSNKETDHQWITETVQEPLPVICVRGRSVIELGCGIGSAGIAAALLGASVTFTDIFESDTGIQSLLDRNLTANLSSRNIAFARQELPWGSVLRGTSGEPVQCDIIIASDCLYRHESVEPFLQTALALCAAHSLVFVFNQGFQEEATDAFWKLAARDFYVKELLAEDVHPMHRGGFETGTKWGAALQRRK